MIDDVFIENPQVLFQAGALQDIPSYTRLSGWRASDLPESGGVDSTTLFAVYRGGQTSGQQYDDISSAIKADGIGLMHVGTMAYADTWQYSPV